MAIKKKLYKLYFQFNKLPHRSNFKWKIIETKNYYDNNNNNVRDL